MSAFYNEIERYPAAWRGKRIQRAWRDARRHERVLAGKSDRESSPPSRINDALQTPEAWRAVWRDKP